MPRKKIVKRGGAKKASSIATVAQLEKEFAAMPARLAQETNKELTALRKKESDLKKAVAQTAAQLKATEARIKSVAANKKSAAGKKQLAAAKKALREAGKIHRSLVSELASIAKSIAHYVEKSSKIKGLSQALAQFNKDWVKQAKNKKNKKVKAKTKVKRSSKPRLKTIESSKAGHSHIENLDASLENVTLDQPVEMAS